jgi:hypothetical protein
MECRNRHYWNDTKIKRSGTIGRWLGWYVATDRATRYPARVVVVIVLVAAGRRFLPSCLLLVLSGERQKIFSDNAVVNHDEDRTDDDNGRRI